MTLAKTLIKLNIKFGGILRGVQNRNWVVKFKTVKIDSFINAIYSVYKVNSILL